MKRFYLLLRLLSIFFLSHPSVGQTGNSTIDSLNQALQDSEQDTSRIKIFEELSTTLIRLGSYDSAFSYAERALKLSEHLKLKKGVANAQNIMGVVHANKSNNLEALKYYFKSLEIRQEIGDKADIAASLNNIGNIYINQADYPQALHYNRRALKLKEEIGDKKGMSISLNSIGNIYVGQGDYPKGLEYHLKSLKLKEEIGSKAGIANSLNNIGNIYGYQKNYAQALLYYQKSLKCKNELGDKKGIAMVLANIGEVYIKLGNYPEALDYSYKSLSIAERIGDKLRIASSLNNIGFTYFQEKNYSRALEYYKKALKTAEEARGKRIIITALNSIGLVYTKQQEYENALNFYNKGLNVAKEIGALEDVQDSEKLLSEIYEQMGNGIKALEHFKQYVLIHDRIYNQENTKKLVRNEMNFEFEKKEAVEKIEQAKRDAVTTTEIEKQKILRNFFIAGLIVALLLAYLVYNRYSIKIKLNAELNNKNILIEAQREKMIDSINYAKDIQQSLLVEESEVQKLFPESFIYYKPKDIVSGDFYWTSSIDGKIIIAAIDCTGHGVPGAFMSMIGNTLLNQIVNEMKITKPSEILKQLHENVYALLHQEQKHSRSQDGMDVALCSIDIATKEIQFAGAKNPLWIIKNNALEIVRGNVYSIGGNQLLKEKKSDARLWSDYSIPGKQGDCIYLFTDGYMDQFGGLSRKKLGGQRFGELLLANHHLEMQKQKTFIRDYFHEWKKNNTQIDDVLVIGIRL